MKWITDLEREEISKCIKNAERKTSCEFVTVIARRSAVYDVYAVVFSLMLAILFPLGLTLLVNDLSYQAIFSYQIVLASVSFAILRMPMFLMRILPKTFQYNNAQRLAREQFIDQNLHSTENRNGVLLFVSAEERYVEILADKGVNDRVDDGFWEEVVSEFIIHVKAGDHINGFRIAIDKVSSSLADYFPIKEDDVNELSDKLIVLE